MDRKTLLPFALAILLLLPMVSAAGVTRILSPPVIVPGGTVTVTLSVDVSGAADYYVIDEIYPSGFTVIDSGPGSIQHSGHWKYLVIEDAQNTQLSYTLQAPSTEGEYSFSGEYMFGGMESTVPISGQSKIYVNSSATDMTGGLLVLLVTVVAVIAIVLVKFKKLR